MSMWRELEKELDTWDATGKTATLWWRDDDATRVTPALERLLTIAAEHDIPVCLAVIPQQAQPDLQSLLERAPGTEVAVHGFSHQNHAGPEEKKCELAESRPLSDMISQLAEGLDALTKLAEDRTLPVLVPPWNRVASLLIPELHALGFRGLSTYGERRSEEPATGLTQMNCHVDPIDWRGSRDFIGTPATLDMFVRHLSRRRAGDADASEPTGLLTHHAVWTSEAFSFLDTLFARTRRHPAVRWMAAGNIFLHAV